jgi:hypothetical protein
LEEQIVKVFGSMIESKLTFLEMQKEGGSAHSAKPSQSGFGITPEALDSINVRLSSSEFIASMTDPIMFFVSEVHKPFISLPTIRVNNAFFIDSPLDNGSESASFDIWDDFCEDLAVSSVDAKNDCFPSCSSTSLSFDTTSPKVAFINFNNSIEGRLTLTKRDYSHPDFHEILVHSIAVQTSNFGDLRSGQIEGKKLE